MELLLLPGQAGEGADDDSDNGHDLEAVLISDNHLMLPMIRFSTTTMFDELLT